MRCCCEVIERNWSYCPLCGGAIDWPDDDDAPPTGPPVTYAQATAIFKEAFAKLDWGKLNSSVPMYGTIKKWK